MPIENINNSNTKKSFVYVRLKRRMLSHVKIIRILILSVILVLIALLGVFIYKAIAQSFVGTSIGMARDFAFPNPNRILTSDERVNLLIMGKGGAGHDAPDLTDTMILASISTTANKMTLISVPRDIWIESLRDKINSAYMYGKQKSPMTGIVLAKSTMESVLGVQIDYGIIIDFGGFQDVIDALGGVQINVQNTFTDQQYPIAGKENDTCIACRYETVTFNKGVQTMNGETALKFVRSRHSTGIEGTDIAREARQQLVIAAILKKAITPQTFTNVSKDKDFLKIFQNDIETDLNPSEEATLARYVLNAKTNIKSYGIPDDLLFTPTNEYKYFNNLYTHAFVFIPNNKQSINGSNEDWSDVQNWVKTVLP
ncbi:N/A [soil metagenome]